MTNTKILFISPQPFFEWRGSPIRVGFNVQALSELGFEIDLLTLPLGEKKRISGVTIRRVSNPLKIKNISIGPSLTKILFDFLLLFKGINLILNKNYHVIHGVEEAGLIAVILSRLKGCKAIYEKHSDPFSHKKGFLSYLLLSVYSKIELLTIKCVDAVIGTGPGLVKQVVDLKTGKPVFHIFDIPSSLIEPSRDTARSISNKLRKTKKDLLITFVGSFAIYQGIDLMFAAIPKVIKENSRARFIIIGGSDEEINIKKKYLAQHGLERSVTFLGKISPDRLPNYLSASDILLAPRMAGVNTPLKLLDYLKVGRAIVATDVEANKLILDDKIAMLTPPNSSDYAKGICQLMENDSFRYTLGINGKKRYHEKYNFKIFKERLSACYQKVLT